MIQKSYERKPSLGDKDKLRSKDLLGMFFDE